jgi:DNA-binding LacI/PurR family transcriptional regulator
MVIAVEALRHPASEGACSAVVKITDVARHAGVSASTVSYVLSGKRSISSETRDRVLTSIRTLGYRPHASARALASSRSNVIALVVPLRSGAYVPILMQFGVSVVTAARGYDHDLLLLTQDEGVEGLERVAGTALVDAVIVMDIETHDSRLPVLREIDTPSVLIGFPADATGLTCIDFDFVAAGALGVRHLAELGCRNVALLGEPSAVYARGTGFAERTLHGFTRTVQELGVTGTVLPCEPAPNAVAETVGRLLRELPGLTGLVVQNEAVVEPMLKAIQAEGRRVPEDLSLIVIGPDELGLRTTPRLTSISLPTQDVAQGAVDLLIAKLDGADVPAATLLPPRLTVRDSTGARRR